MGPGAASAAQGAALIGSLEGERGAGGQRPIHMDTGPRLRAQRVEHPSLHLEAEVPFSSGLLRNGCPAGGVQEQPEGWFSRLGGSPVPPPHPTGPQNQFKKIL